MKISKQEVEHVANLAMLKLSDEEIEKYTCQLGQIVEFVEQLNEVDVTGIEPTAHILDIENIFRNDITQESYPRDVMLNNAPSKSGGCYSVPQVVE